MKNRQPTKPGRVKIIPENGDAFYAAMEMADEPTEVGDPPTKENLLKDETAALFGLGADAVPDDAFVKINQLISPTAKIEVGSYAGTGETTKTFSFSFVPKLLIIYPTKYSDWITTYYVNGARAAIKATAESRSGTTSGGTAGVVGNGASSIVVFNGTTITAATAEECSNKSNNEYSYIAIG